MCLPVFADSTPYASRVKCIRNISNVFDSIRRFVSQSSFVNTKRTIRTNYCTKYEASFLQQSLIFCDVLMIV